MVDNFILFIPKKHMRMFIISWSKVTSKMERQAAIQDSMYLLQLSTNLCKSKKNIIYND